MPFAILEKDFERLDDAQQKAVVLFIRFLLTQSGGQSDVCNTEVSLSAPLKKRHAGGLEGKFYMSPDFDEPLEEFSEYM